uniref:Purine nucleoside phosphorylase n=2 Tax=Hirondellea gigas TaxID=1518452 RepID=A0A6A7FLR4_9CRUS
MAPTGINGREAPDVQALASGGGFMCLEQTVTGTSDHDFRYELLEESAQFLLDGTKHRPNIAIICGSGLGSLATELEERDEFPYETVPHFPVSTVTGHAGKMVLGLLSGIPVMCMQGRFHAYEGYPLWKVSMPVRVMKLMGIEQIIVTNAAGGLNEKYNVGDIMFIKDHINMQGFAGDSPLRGRNEERFGPRFLCMNNAYDKELRSLAREAAQQLGLMDIVKEGVYVMLGGPTYETVAELRLLSILGVDAVGMSTVPEVIVARHCGMKVFAFSLITNKCITDYETDLEPNHAEVIEAANARQKDLKELVKKIVSKMAAK